MADSYLAATVFQILNLLGPSPYTSYFCKTFKYQGVNGTTSGNVYSRLLGPFWSLPPNWASRNVPAFIIDLASEERVTGRNVAKTFSNARSGAGDVNIEDTCTLLFRIVYANTDRVIPSNVDEFLKGVLLADPTLGLISATTGPTVRTSGQWSSTMKDENSDDTGGTLRCIHRVRFPITFLYNRANLNAMATFAG